MGKFDGCLLCSDIDGTLVRGGDPVPRRNREAVERFKSGGGHFAIATGRSARNAERIWRQSGSDTRVICGNGSALYDYGSGEYAYRLTLAENLKPPVPELALRYGTGVIVDCDGTDSFVLRYSPEVEEHNLRVGAAYPVVTYEELAGRSWDKVLFLTKSPRAAEEMFARLRAMRLPGAAIARTEATYVEIQPEGTDKAAGATRLREMLGASRLFAIGDYDNDLNMLRAADISATVEGAPDYIKSEVGFVCGSAESGAVADFIEYLGSTVRSR